VIQGDASWLAIKAAKLSGSRFRAVLDLNKRTGAPNKPRRDLVADLRRELQTGVLTAVEPNEYMAHGTRCEPIACALYAFTYDVDVQHAAWLPHPTLDYVGFSPDGLVGDDGMIEIKSPALEPRHLRTVDSGKCPDDYVAQVQGGLWVTGRQWCEFLSFWEPTHDLCVVRVHRDEQFIQRLADECASVWAEVINQREVAA
jgi:predicted phage-related endonuclease